MKIKHRPGGTTPAPVRSSLSRDSPAAARIQPQKRTQKTKYSLPPAEKFIPYKP